MMAQPEPVTTATTGAVWSQQPARPWPHKIQEGGRGGGPGRHKSGSSMPLTLSRRFMGLLRAHWLHRGERRGSPCSHHPWGPCSVPAGGAGRGAGAWEPLQATLRALEALPPPGLHPPLCPQNQPADPRLTAEVSRHKSFP